MKIEDFRPQPPWTGPPVPKWCNIGWPTIPRSSNPESEVEEPNEEVEEPIVDKPVELDKTDNADNTDKVEEPTMEEKPDENPNITKFKKFPVKAQEKAINYTEKILKYLGGE